MIRRLKMFSLQCRAAVLEAQIDHGEALLADHHQRLRNCYDEMRRVKSQLATITPASTLLLQAMRRKV